MAMRVCVIVDNPLTYDRRVLRQVRALRGANHDVTVIALDDPGVPGCPDLAGATFIGIPSFGGLRVAGRVRGNKSENHGVASSSLLVRVRNAAARGVSRLSFHLGYQRYLRRSFHLGRGAIPIRPHVCHANNLGSLPAALACKLTVGSSVVYDAHELESARANFSWLARLRARLVERACIRHADRVVAASSSYATYLAGRYRIPPPTVVRNVADAQDYPGELSVRTDDGRPATLLYIGAIQAGRGLEQLIDALPLVSDVRVVMVGPDVRLAANLLRRAVDIGVRRRVEVRPPVLPEDLGGVLRQADFGYCGIENVALSYYYALPNKIFQYLAHGLPVVASDLPEARALLAGSGAGALFEPGSPERLAEAIATVLAGDRAALRTRALELGRANSWEQEQDRLVRLYDDLGLARERRRRAWRRFPPKHEP